MGGILQRRHNPSAGRRTTLIDRPSVLPQGATIVGEGKSCRGVVGGPVYEQNKLSIAQAVARY